MKIAILSSNTLSTPPDLSTVQPGWTTSIHDVVSMITEGLVARGHDVTLFASGDSKTTAKLESAWDTATVKHWVSSDQFLYVMEDQILIAYCFHKNLTEKYDLIYSYHALDVGPFAYTLDCPIVATIHGPGAFDLEQKFMPRFIKQPIIVGLSKPQTKNMLLVKFTEIISHGIDQDLFDFDEKGGEDLIYVGRLTAQKGIDKAMKIASDLNKTLKIIGTGEEDYIQSTLNSLVTDYTQLLGKKSKEEISEYFKKSKAMLFPIRWDEPFGLVAIESLSTGTPVIAFAKGAMPEIIEDGKTGFLVNLDEKNINGDWIIKETGEEGIRKAIAKIYGLTNNEYEEMRLNCRNIVLNKYTKEIMINKYENLFERIIKGEVE